MDFSFRKVEDGDARQIIAIFNYFVKNGFAAYPEQELPAAFFHKLKEMSAGYPFYVIETEGQKVVGFGLLRPYHFIQAFKHTAETSYFILPEFVGKGLGSKLLSLLTEETKSLDIRVLLANISSLNTPSLNFHLNHGFIECGRFQNIGTKFGKGFDVVWMQKFIN